MHGKPPAENDDRNRLAFISTTWSRRWPVCSFVRFVSVRVQRASDIYPLDYRHWLHALSAVYRCLVDASVAPCFMQQLKRCSVNDDGKQDVAQCQQQQQQKQRQQPRSVSSRRLSVETTTTMTRMLARDCMSWTCSRQIGCDPPLYRIRFTPSRGAWSNTTATTNRQRDAANVVSGDARQSGGTYSCTHVSFQCTHVDAPLTN